MPQLDVLIPTCERPAALAVTLTSLCAQTQGDFRVIVSDQSERIDSRASGEIQTVLRVLALHGVPVVWHRHLPRRGMAEQRQFLLDQSSAPYVLYLDDDLLLEPDLIARMLNVIRREGCGFVGCAPIGLSYVDEVRPHQQAVEFWDGPVQPEQVEPGSAAWQRHHLHSAANLLHVQQRLGIHADAPRTYKVAWIGACVLYDATCLREVGGFGFWSQLPPEHCGEDVLAQLRVMARYGGCGILPSGVYHLELPTTIADRRVNAPELLEVTGAATA